MKQHSVDCNILPSCSLTTYDCMVFMTNTQDVGEKNVIDTFLTIHYINDNKLYNTESFRIVHD